MPIRVIYRFSHEPAAGLLSPMRTVERMCLAIQQVLWILYSVASRPHIGVEWIPVSEAKTPQRHLRTWSGSACCAQNYRPMRRIERLP